MSKRVLVTDGEERSALAVVRSLGAAGHTVFVAAKRRRSLAGSSRFATDCAAAPSPLEQPVAFRTAVRDLIRRWHIDVLLPMSEPALLALLPLRGELGVDLPFPDFDRFRHICDKAAVMDAARRAGIRVPAQHIIEAPSGDALLPDDLAFPLVIKPARSVTGDTASRRKRSVVHVSGPVQLERALASFSADAYPILVQQRVVGPGIGIFVLLRDGRLDAAFSHRRIREKPPSGGVSVFRESIPLDPDLLDRSLALLREFDWSGVAMVEFKIDQDSGEAFIMEINGRFWGSLQLAIDAGVDFPRLLLEPPAQPVLSYRPVRSRWEWGEVDHLIARMRHSTARLNLPPESPGRSRALLDFLAAFRPGNSLEVLRARDPRPFIHETRSWFGRG
ncbi:MAG TPA: ATP-grasp domain-containing protein [Longimicrobiales bacterium]|nr:ATP-grasp domain-containing protein [Longimicrobiales bacterium]